MEEISEVSSQHSLRKGKWTAEEEEYTRKLVQYFNQGLLTTIPDGTTLRSFLSSRLQCDRMRITKKFRGVSWQHYKTANLMGYDDSKTDNTHCFSSISTPFLYMY